MGNPRITIDRLDPGAGTPTVLGELGPDIDGGVVDLGGVVLSSESDPFVFRIRIADDADWNGATALSDVLVWASCTALAEDGFLIGFTDVWGDIGSTTLAPAPTSMDATPNAPSSWDLTQTPALLVSGYCVMKFAKGAKAYPSAPTGGDGAGTLRVHISRGHD